MRDSLVRKETPLRLALECTRPIGESSNPLEHKPARICSDIRIELNSCRINAVIAQRTTPLQYCTRRF
jgi:hypothetical protein